MHFQVVLKRGHMYSTQFPKGGIALMSYFLGIFILNDVCSKGKVFGVAVKAQVRMPTSDCAVPVFSLQL